jgi:hypothetical protein
MEYGQGNYSGDSSLIGDEVRNSTRAFGAILEAGRRAKNVKELGLSAICGERKQMP